MLLDSSCAQKRTLNSYKRNVLYYVARKEKEQKIHSRSCEHDKSVHTDIDLKETNRIRKTQGDCRTDGQRRIEREKQLELEGKGMFIRFAVPL